MSRSTRVGMLAGATALTLTGVSVASPTANATNDELQAQVEQLSARVMELEGRNSDQWMNEQRAEEIRGLVHDVLADADTRASLLQSGMTAGYDRGFRIGSSDGNFMLRLNGQLQTRWNYSYQSGGAGPDGDRHRSGFETTRAKLWFSGHIVNPDWQYVLETGLNDGTGEWSVLDAYIKHNLCNGWSLKAGQFMAPLLREELMDSRYQLAVERSIFNQLLTGGRTTGIALGYEADQFRFVGSYNDGANQAGTRWSQGPGPQATDGSTEYSFTARGELLLSGNWDQFKEFRSAPGEEQGVMIGAAIHVQEDEYGTAFNNEATFVVVTGDVSAKFGGFNLFGAVAYANLDPKEGASNDFWGFVAQGGFHFTDQWEGFLRYEWADLDNIKDLSILTWGVNYYFADHNAKFTADMGYSFNELEILGTNLADGNIAGYRADTDSGQFVVRTQLQLAF